MVRSKSPMTPSPIRPAALAFVLFLALVAGCRVSSSAGAQSPLTVSAASDLTLAFREVGERFEGKTGIPVVFNFGSTGQLAQQIERGAPVDVFAAANAVYVEELEHLGLIIPETRSLYARGRITLWTRADVPVRVERVQDLARPEIRRVAIANPDHAPYGIAARQALQSAGLWDAVRPKLVLAENVSQTLQYADTGNVDVAITALSLSIGTDGRWELVPEDLHAPIDQALAVVNATRREREARLFAAFVSGPEGRPIMRRYGFTLPEEETP